jgi:hypothetical protein
VAVTSTFPGGSETVFTYGAPLLTFGTCAGGHRSETFQASTGPLPAGDPAPPRPAGADGAAGEGSAT